MLDHFNFTTVQTKEHTVSDFPKMYLVTDIEKPPISKSVDPKLNPVPLFLSCSLCTCTIGCMLSVLYF